MAENILSGTSLTNLLQKEDNDLLHAVTETRVVIKLCNDERADQNVWNVLYDKAVDFSNLTLPFTQQCQEELVVSPDVQTVSNFYRVTLYYVFLDH